MRYISPLSLGLFFALLLLSGCTYTLDPQALQPSIPSPNDDGNQSPAYIAPPDVNTPADINVLPPTPDANTIMLPIPPSPAPTIVLSLAEVKKHNSQRNCWMVVHGNVYNLSSFTNHPGGRDYIPFCGKDGTHAFEAQGHSATADRLLATFYLGQLDAVVPQSSVGG
ncbi:MAG: cytochrome b5 domain-containing protein [Candidatus Iainarchaeum archaeon]|uniref:Cytochrome b5 domain-containing protein n=1 Tax=Candidatus Iainarchaeum sp. TaxID=3101447 RepID=A0A7T9I1H7_9ARCH|nr:MAG: cytochrome b5 domain-containing protein [Candidatus Diapherotrites archaeon]